jgi:hypothetical protein
MKYLIIILALQFLFSCKESEPFQDERLLPYAEKVRVELSDRGINFGLGFELTLKPKLSIERKANGLSLGNVIYIDSAMFYRRLRDGKEFQIELLMAHEIGHNVFGLNHSKERFDSLQRPDLMYPSNSQKIKFELINDAYDLLSERLH